MDIVAIIKTGVTFVQDQCRRLAFWLSWVLSWAIWTPGILVMSVIFWRLHWSDPLMLLLTIQTSVDSAATKTMQSAFKAGEEARDKYIESLLLRIQDLEEQILEEVEKD